MERVKQGGCAVAPTSARCGFRRQRFGVRVPEEVAGKLRERALVHVPLEIDHRIERDPVLIPSPSVEFGALRGAQSHVAFTADKPEQKPYLLLPAVVSPPIPLEPARGNLVAQPVPCPAQDLHVRGEQAHLLLQLPVHSLHGRFPDLDSALRELPGVLFDALAPENLVAPVAQDDADVRPVAVSIEHTQSSKSLFVLILPQIPGDLKPRSAKRKRRGRVQVECRVWLGPALCALPDTFSQRSRKLLPTRN